MKADVIARGLNHVVSAYDVLQNTHSGYLMHQSCAVVVSSSLVEFAKVGVDLVVVRRVHLGADCLVPFTLFSLGFCDTRLRETQGSRCTCSCARLVDFKSSYIPTKVGLCEHV